MEELRSKPQNHSFRTTQKENKQRQMASVRGREYLSTFKQLCYCYFSL